MATPNTTNRYAKALIAGMAAPGIDRFAAWFARSQDALGTIAHNKPCYNDDPTAGVGP